MDSICYLRTHGGLDVLRLGPETVTLQDNDFGHAEWCLDPGTLSAATVVRVHSFCAAQGLAAPDWSVMAARRF